MRSPDEIAEDLQDLAVGWCRPDLKAHPDLVPLLNEAAEALRRHEAYVRVCGGKHAVRYLESDQICPYCVLADAEAERELMRKEVGGWRKEHHLVTTERDRLRLGLVNAGAEMSEIRDERDALIAAIEKAIGELELSWSLQTPTPTHAALMILRAALPEPLRQRIEAGAAG